MFPSSDGRIISVKKIPVKQLNPTRKSRNYRLKSEDFRMKILPAVLDYISRLVMTEMKDTVIVLDRASRRFGRRDALKSIDLQVRNGTMLGLIGPNGSGKTTLLKLMAGFINKLRFG